MSDPIDSSASLRCLVVDDSAADLTKLSDSLEELGHQVQTTQDPTSVGAHLQQAAPDVLFLDIVMPSKNGYAVLREVKKSHPDLPAVMVSSKGEDSDLNWAFLQGASAYLVKPYSVDQVEECLVKARK